MNFRPYNLFLDDVRFLDECSYMNDPRYTTRNWIIVRSYDQFVSELQRRWEMGQFPELVSFDHDLADEHYHGSMFDSASAYNEAAQNFREKTGNDAAKFLVQFCIDHLIDLPECLVHSMNPVGRTNIKNTLLDWNRYQAKFSK